MSWVYSKKDSPLVATNLIRHPGGNLGSWAVFSQLVDFASLDAPGYGRVWNLNG